MVNRLIVQWARCSDDWCSLSMLFRRWMFNWYLFKWFLVQYTLFKTRCSIGCCSAHLEGRFTRARRFRAPLNPAPGFQPISRWNKINRKLCPPNANRSVCRLEYQTWTCMTGVLAPAVGHPQLFSHHRDGSDIGRGSTSAVSVNRYRGYLTLTHVAYCICFQLIKLTCSPGRWLRSKLFRTERPKTFHISHHGDPLRIESGAPNFGQSPDS